MSCNSWQTRRAVCLSWVATHDKSIPQNFAQILWPLRTNLPLKSGQHFRGGICHELQLMTKSSPKFCPDFMATQDKSTHKIWAKFWGWFCHELQLMTKSTPKILPRFYGDRVLSGHKIWAKFWGMLFSWVATHDKRAARCVCHELQLMTKSSPKILPRF